MTQRIDARGLLCPLPVLRLRKRLLTLAPGARVTLVATDRAAVIDVPHFCAQSGHILIEAVETAPGQTEYTVERGPARPEPAQPKSVQPKSAQPGPDA